MADEPAATGRDCADGAIGDVAGDALRRRAARAYAAVLYSSCSLGASLSSSAARLGLLSVPQARMSTIKSGSPPQIEPSAVRIELTAGYDLAAPLLSHMRARGRASRAGFRNRRLSGFIARALSSCVARLQ